MSKLISVKGYDIKISKKEVIEKVEMISHDCKGDTFGICKNITNIMYDIAKNSLDNIEYKKVHDAFWISYWVGGRAEVNEVTLKTNTNLTSCVKALMVICDELLSYGDVEYVDKLLPNYRPVWFECQEVENTEPVQEVPKAESVMENPEPVAVQEVTKTDSAENEMMNISAYKLNNIYDLIEHCEHFTTKRELLSIVSSQFKISNDTAVEIYNQYMDNLYLDEDENIEPVEKVGLDINTSYPELQCFEDIEEVEENTVFKVGCFYTGSDKSLYLVTKRGLNTIDLMSISKGFQEYDMPIVTDIYDNEYVTISYSNRISVISSINLTYTEKSFKRMLYDFVNNNFYGNDVYGKYDEEDVKRVLNMLRDKIID